MEGGEINMDKLYESDYVKCFNLAFSHAEEYERAKDAVRKKHHKEKCL